MSEARLSWGQHGGRGSCQSCRLSLGAWRGLQTLPVPMSLLWGGGPSVPSGLSLDLLVSPWPQQKPSIHAGSKPTLSSSLEDAPARTETLAATRVGSPSPPRRLRCLQGSGQTPRWMLADSVRHPEHRRHRAPSSQFRSVVSDSVTPWTGGLWSGLEFLFKELHTVLFSAPHSSCVSSDHHVCIT